MELKADIKIRISQSNIYKKTEQDTQKHTKNKKRGFEIKTEIAKVVNSIDI